jgi:hypothetical protein
MHCRKTRHSLYSHGNEEEKDIDQMHKSNIANCDTGDMGVTGSMGRRSHLKFS